jgi:hypothetical protein
MADRPIVRFVDVAIEKDTPSVSAAGFGTPLVFTNNILLSTARRVREFTDDTSVGDFFGTDSEEYLYANAYYNQDPFNDDQPESLKFGAYASEARGALLEMGDSPLTDIEAWKAITDGSFRLINQDGTNDITDLDFSSVTSLNDVAEVINAAFADDDVESTCYFLINRFNIRNVQRGSSSTIELLSTVDPADGTDISGSGFLDGDNLVSPTNPGGSYISPGCGELTPAVLYGGNDPTTTFASESGWWVTGLSGEYALTINGDSIAPTGISTGPAFAGDMDDIADILTATLGGAGNCVWNATIGRLEITSSIVGEDSTITFMSDPDLGGDYFGGPSQYFDMDAGSVANGAFIVQGAVTAGETFAEAIEAVENIDNDWYAMSIISTYRDTSDIQDMADEIESRRKIFISTTNDSNVLVLGSTSTTAYYVKEANYKRTGFIYYDNATLYPDAAWLGLQLPKDIGTTNWAYKELPGIAEGALADIDPVDLTEAQKDAALDVNVNVYTETLGASFTYFGTMGGGRNVDKDGEYIDIVRNIDFLQARVEEGLLSLLLERDIIPYTNAGISIVDNRLLSLLDTYGVKQGILVTGSVVTSFPTRAETSQTDRDNRLLPDGTFQAQLQGGINVIIVRGTVFI